jgi:hypothetical protein
MALPSRFASLSYCLFIIKKFCDSGNYRSQTKLAQKKKEEKKMGLESFSISSVSPLILAKR